MKSKIVLFGWILVLALMGLSNVRAGEVKGWRVIINIPAYTLYLYQGADIWQQFPVAVGKPDTPSPVGDFWIVNKVADPVWYPEGRKPVPQGTNNPLGRYWLGLNKRGYGIHGNNAPLSIGHPVSKGCFRMNNQDIEKLFQLLPKGTPVQVIYRTVLGEMDAQNRLWLKIFSDFYQLDNLEQAVNHVLAEFNKFYSPHYDALEAVLQHRSESTVEVPRRIKVDGEYQSEDAFFWNGEVYLNRSHFDFEFQQIAVEESNLLFPEYIRLTSIQQFSSRLYKYIWDEPSGIVHIYAFKSYFNGVEVTNLGKLLSGRPWINLQELANLLGSRFDWNKRNEYATVGGERVKGMVDGEGFWVMSSWVVTLFPDLGVLWDETSWILKLEQKFSPDLPADQINGTHGLRQRKKR